MYLHIGREVTVRTKNIIGIFDLESTTTSKISKSFLRECEQEGFIKNVSEEIPKSFIIEEKNDKIQIYFTNISTTTLQKRAKDNLNIIGG